MADDKAKPGGQDAKRINLSEEFAFRDWAKKFGVTPERLRDAVLSVGTWATAVERELGRARS